MRDYNNIFSETKFLHEGTGRMLGYLFIDSLTHHPFDKDIMHDTKGIPAAKQQLIRLLNHCKSMKDIEYIRRELDGVSLNNTINRYYDAINDPSDSRHKTWAKRKESGFDIKEFEKYVEWVNNDYRKMINDKAKEIRSKNKK